MVKHRNATIGKLSHLSHHFKQARMNGLEKLGLYPGQPRLLTVLREKEGISQRDLAEQMHVTPATLSRMIGRMEKNGYLERRPDEKDQRITRVYGTDRSRELMDELDKANTELEEELFAGFTDEEKDRFFQYVDRINENVHSHGNHSFPYRERRKKS